MGLLFGFIEMMRFADCLKAVAIRKKLCYNSFKALYISNHLIVYCGVLPYLKNLTAYQKEKISMLLFTENRNKCREVEQKIIRGGGLTWLTVSVRDISCEGRGVFILWKQKMIPNRTYKGYGIRHAVSGQRAFAGTL